MDADGSPGDQPGLDDALSRWISRDHHGDNERVNRRIARYPFSRARRTVGSATVACCGLAAAAVSRLRRRQRAMDQSGAVDGLDGLVELDERGCSFLGGAEWRSINEA